MLGAAGAAKDCWDDSAAVMAHAVSSCLYISSSYYNNASRTSVVVIVDDIFLNVVFIRNF